MQVLLDVWGVLHDGHTPYEDAVRFLERAHRAGVPVSLVTNASWSSARMIGSLRKMGFDLGAIDTVWTAGQVARRVLVERRPDRVVYEGRDDGAWMVEGFRVVVDPADADLFVLADPTSNTVRRLEVALRAGVPVLCANPDLFIEDRHGNQTTKAGSLAAAYERAGGRVIRAGKPDARIFQLAWNGGDAVMIGDGVLTDLQGAREAGLPSIWVARRGVDPEVVRTWQPRTVVQSLDEIPLG